MVTNLTIGKRVALGVGLVAAFGIVVGGGGYLGIQHIVDTAAQAAAGNRANAQIVEATLQQNLWLGDVAALLSDEQKHTLAVPLDDHECGFGQWLYGPQRQRAVELVPTLGSLFEELEAQHAELHRQVAELVEYYQPANIHLPDKLREIEIAHQEWVTHLYREVLENAPALTVQTDPTKCVMGRWLASAEVAELCRSDAKLAELIEGLRQPHEQLHAWATQLQKNWRPTHPGLLETLTARLEDHRKWVAILDRACISGSADFELETDPTKCKFGRFLASEQCQRWCADFPELKKLLEACREPHQRLHASAISIRKALQAGDVEAARRIYLETATPALKALAGDFGQAVELEKQLVADYHAAQRFLSEKIVPTLERTKQALAACLEHARQALDGQRQARAVFASQVQPQVAKLTQTLDQLHTEIANNIVTDAQMLADARSIERLVAIGGTVGLAVAVLATVLITRSMKRRLVAVVEGLQDGAEQVDAASTQVSSASQQLAEAASEQASSLEQTSSALEQMSAQARRSADNASTANDLAMQARGNARRGGETMSQLQAAMAAINDSSAEISKIIKVIEEIAFQTNLLALNAAVEAARAGEHGKGFAVVAEEVRNLAQRSAQAARDTTRLIEDSVSRARGGTEVVDAAATALQSIVGDVEQIADLLRDIKQAADEQAQGVEQINAAVAQMDRATQQNAAGAEQSASAAEQLASMAVSLKDQFVADLIALVHGSQRRSERRFAAGLARVSGTHDGRPVSFDAGARDRSTYGIGLRSRQPLDVGSACRIELQRRDGGVEHLSGRVARCEPAADGSYTIGVEFTQARIEDSRPKQQAATAAAVDATPTATSDDLLEF